MCMRPDKSSDIIEIKININFSSVQHTEIKKNRL